MVTYNRTSINIVDIRAVSGSEKWICIIDSADFKAYFKAKSLNWLASWTEITILVTCLQDKTNIEKSFKNCKKNRKAASAQLRLISIDTD